jgi:hypothetical protein
MSVYYTIKKCKLRLKEWQENQINKELM